MEGPFKAILLPNPLGLALELPSPLCTGYLLLFLKGEVLSPAY